MSGTGDLPLVVCVLGCRAGSPTLARRARACAETYRALGATLAVACGARVAYPPRPSSASGALSIRGTTHDTRDNARFAAALLGRRGIGRVALVTCSWHLPRAERAFRAAGLEVEGVGVDPPEPTLLQRVYWRQRERLSSWNDARRGMR